MSDEKESLARTQLPYRAEYCKTSRAKCKKCNEPMLAGTLKLASSSKSRFHDGLDYNYHHVECFFRIKRPGSVAEIGHYETLKYDDQKIIENAIETNGRSVLASNSSAEKPSKETKHSEKKKKRDAPTKPTATCIYDDFLVEYAKSSRSTCIKCEQKIEKNLLRLGKLDYNAETPFKGGPIPRWYHSECFAKSLDKLEFDGEISKIQGFEDLEKDDQKLLNKSIKPTPKAECPESASKKIKKEDTEEEKLLKRQSKRFFDLRDQVSTMRRKDIEAMLENMKQKHDYKNSATLIDMATDALLFGPLKKCPQCKKSGQMMLRAGTYICGNKIDGDQECSYESRDPRRDVPEIPDDVMDSYDFLEEYEFRGGKRLFPSGLVKAIEEKEAENNNIVPDDGPLNGLTIGVTSWQAINTDRAKVQKKVVMLGGKLITALDKSLFVILSSEDELKKNTPKIEVAKALGVPFATEEFLFKIQTKDDVVKQLTKCLIEKWDGDLYDRFTKMRVVENNDSPVKQE